MAVHFIAECLDCHSTSPFIGGSSTCPNCGSEWREAKYDYAHLTHSLPLLLPGRPFDIWRYRELLPVRSPQPALSLGEGGTPLIHAHNLGLMLGCEKIFIKDERQGPTSSFKDRQGSIAIAALKEAGIQDCVTCSTGNVAIAYSAYAARAGIHLWAFLTSLVPAAKMREVALYGTQVVKVTGTYDQAKKLAADFAKQRNIYYDSGAKSIPCIEAMKTIAFEACEQLTAVFGSPSIHTDKKMQPLWQSPDWYIQSVSGGMGPLGVIKGFIELKHMGLIDKVPKIACIQVEGCAPMVHAWVQKKDTAQAVQSPQTSISVLATGDPGRTYTLLKKKMDENSGGAFISVSDDEAFRATHFAAKMEGLSVEPAAAVAFAGLIKLVRDGTIKTDESIVINCSGHTMSIEQNVLGDGWMERMTQTAQSFAQRHEEGLLAALSNISLEKFPRIAIVDDNSDVRILIKRILKTQGNYELLEAENGREAVQLALREKPNLMILDLMMPEMDGFGVMDALKNNAETADIPIIILTAKELTMQEKQRLNGHIQALLQKGNFESDALVDEIKALLN